MLSKARRIGLKNEKKSRLYPLPFDCQFLLGPYFLHNRFHAKHPV